MDLVGAGRRGERRPSPPPHQQVLVGRQVLTEADVAPALTGGAVDVVASHDAPDRVSVPNIGRQLGWPTDVTVDADNHRRLLLTVCEELRPRQLWHGHYHCRYDDQLYVGTLNTRPDWDGVCYVHGLDCDDTSPDANLAFAAADGTPLGIGRASGVR